MANIDRMRCTDAELEVLLHAFMYALCHANIDIAKFLSRKTVRKIPRSAGPLLFRHALTQRNAGAVRFLYAKRHQTNRTSCPFSLPNMTGTDNCTLIHSHEYINCTWPDGSILHVIANLYDPDETEFPTEAMADMVLGWGAELEAGGEPMNRSPLHITVEAGDMRLAKYLINRGAAVNSTDYAARSPLFYAVMEADHSMATLLLSREAQVNRRDTDRMTPLHMATSLSDVSMMWLLIEKYAEIDPTDHSANTPLHIAATLEDAGPVKLLLEHGADSQLVNFHGNTPLDIAREMGCKAAKRELKYHLIRAYLRVCVDEILGVSSGLFLRLRYRITSDLCY
ncbi:ankyrin repeat-containing domain protein [Aspergillus varians]